MKQKIYIQTKDEERMVAYHSHPDDSTPAVAGGTVIMMVHDFPGNTSSYDKLFDDLSENLVKRGFHTLSFDFAGCGESEGQEKNFSLEKACVDFRNVLGWSKGQGYENYIYIGAGLGATLSILNYQKYVSGMVMLWPVLDLNGHAELHFKNLADESEDVGFAVRNGHQIGFDFVKELEDIDLSDKIAKITEPVLIMHGAEDEVVPIDHLDVIREHASGRRLEITSFQDGNHGLTQSNHRHALAYHINQFVERYF